MDDLDTLYARYDGPLPRRTVYTVSPACREQMMLAHLHNIRINRHNGMRHNLGELVSRLKEIRRFLVR